MFEILRTLLANIKCCESEIVIDDVVAEFTVPQVPRRDRSASVYTPISIKKYDTTAMQATLITEETETVEV